MGGKHRTAPKAERPCDKRAGHRADGARKKRATRSGQRRGHAVSTSLAGASATDAAGRVFKNHHGQWEVTARWL